VLNSHSRRFKKILEAFFIAACSACYGGEVFVAVGSTNQVKIDPNGAEKPGHLWPGCKAPCVCIKKMFAFVSDLVYIFKL